MITDDKTENTALYQVKLLYNRLKSIIRINREKTEEAKITNNADNALIGFLIVYFLSISIIEWPLFITDIIRWFFIVFVSPILWFAINWFLLWIEDKLRSPDLYSSQFNGTLRLFIYILIPLWIFYLINYTIFLFFVNYDYYTMNYLIILILNIFLLKTAFKQKEFLTCVINSMFGVSISALLFVFTQA